MKAAGTNLRDPMAVARGLGSAKGGIQHWWLQRVTAIALAVLFPWFVWLALSLLGANLDEARSALAQPLTATLLLAFVIALFWHAKLGLQVVIEDYVHTHWQELALQIVVNFACFLGALAAIVAIGRIAFGS